LNGLTEGEEIATNGTFSIDAAAQLAGRPSMMNPDGGVFKSGHDHGTASNTSGGEKRSHSLSIGISKKAKEEIKTIFDEYLKLKNALVKDDFENAVQISSALIVAINKTNMGVFTGEAHDVWMKHSSEMEVSLRKIAKSGNIGEMRKQFKSLSDELILLAVTFAPLGKELYIQHCPMANDNNGADWISGDKTIKNPYFGESMIGCGEVTKVLK
jgi:Cu(I)/Ag(I) efflux system membrane fusion protein